MDFFPLFSLFHSDSSRESSEWKWNRRWTGYTHIHGISIWWMNGEGDGGSELVQSISISNQTTDTKKISEILIFIAFRCKLLPQNCVYIGIVVRNLYKNHFLKRKREKFSHILPLRLWSRVSGGPDTHLVRWRYTHTQCSCRWQWPFTICIIRTPFVTRPTVSVAILSRQSFIIN